MLGRVQRTCGYSLEDLFTLASSGLGLVKLSCLQEEQESSLGVRIGVPSAVKKIAANSHGVQRGLLAFFPYFTFLQRVGVALAFFTHPERTRTRGLEDSEGLCHQPRWNRRAGGYGPGFQPSPCPALRGRPVSPAPGWEWQPCSWTPGGGAGAGAGLSQRWQAGAARLGRPAGRRRIRRLPRTA